MSNLKIVSVDEFQKDYKSEIASYAISGFDLVVTLRDGRTVKIEDGLSKALLGEFTLVIDNTPVNNQQLVAGIRSVVLDLDGQEYLTNKQNDINEKNIGGSESEIGNPYDIYLLQGSKTDKNAEQSEEDREDKEYKEKQQELDQAAATARSLKDKLDKLQSQRNDKETEDQKGDKKYELSKPPAPEEQPTKFTTTKSKTADPILPSSAEVDPGKFTNNNETDGSDELKRPLYITAEIDDASAAYYPIHSDQPPQKIPYYTSERIPGFSGSTFGDSVVKVTLTRSASGGISTLFEVSVVADPLGNWEVPSSLIRQHVPAGLTNGQYELTASTVFTNADNTDETAKVVQPVFVSVNHISQEGFTSELDFIKDEGYRIYVPGVGIKEPSTGALVTNQDPFVGKGLPNNTSLLKDDKFIATGTVQQGLQVTVIDEYVDAAGLKQEVRHPADVIGIETQNPDGTFTVVGRWSAEIIDLIPEVAHTIKYEISDFKGNRIEVRDLSALEDAAKLQVPPGVVDYADTAAISAQPLIESHIFIDSNKPVIKDVDLNDQDVSDTGISHTDRITKDTVPVLKATISGDLLQGGGKIFLVTGNRKAEITNESISYNDPKYTTPDPTTGKVYKALPGDETQITITPPAFHEGSYKWYIEAVSVTGVVAKSPEKDITIDITIDKPNIELEDASDTIAGTYDATTHFGYADSAVLKKFRDDDLTKALKPVIALGVPTIGDTFHFELKQKSSLIPLIAVDLPNYQDGDITSHINSFGTLGGNKTDGFNFTPKADLAAGQYEYIAKYTDVAGNESIQNGSFTVTEAPVIKVNLTNQGSSDVETTAPKPSLEGVLPANSQITIVIADESVEGGERRIQEVVDVTGAFSIPFTTTELTVGKTYIYSMYVTTPEGHEVKHDGTVQRIAFNAKNAEITDIKLYYKDSTGIEKANASIAATNLPIDLEGIDTTDPSGISFKMTAQLMSGGNKSTVSGNATITLIAPNGNTLEIPGKIVNGKVKFQKTKEELDAISWNDPSGEPTTVTAGQHIPDALYTYKIHAEVDKVKIEDKSGQLLIDRVPPTINMVAGKLSGSDFVQVGKDFNRSSDGKHKIMTAELTPVFSGKTEGYSTVSIVIKKPDGTVFSTTETRADSTGFYAVKTATAFPNPATEWSYEVTTTDMAGNVGSSTGLISVANIKYPTPRYNAFWLSDGIFSSAATESRKYTSGGATGKEVYAFLDSIYNKNGVDTDNKVAGGFLTYRSEAAAGTTSYKINEKDDSNVYVSEGKISPVYSKDGVLFPLPPYVDKQATSDRDPNNPSGIGYQLNLSTTLFDYYGNVTPAKADVVGWSSIRPLINTSILGPNEAKSRVIDDLKYGFEHEYDNSLRVDGRTKVIDGVVTDLPNLGITQLDPVLRVEIPVPTGSYVFEKLNTYEVTLEFAGQTIVKNIYGAQYVGNRSGMTNAVYGSGTLSGTRSYRLDFNLAEISGQSALNTGTYVYSIKVKDSLGNEFIRSESLQITDVPFYINELDNTGELIDKTTSVSKDLRIVANDSGNQEIKSAHLVLTRTDGKDITADRINTKIKDYSNVTLSADRKSLTYYFKQNTGDENDKRWMAHLGQTTKLSDGTYKGTLTRVLTDKTTGKDQTVVLSDQFTIDTVTPVINALNPTSDSRNINGFVYDWKPGNDGNKLDVTWIVDNWVNRVTNNPKTLTFTTEPNTNVRLELTDPVTGIKNSYTTKSNSSGLVTINDIFVGFKLDPVTGLNSIYKGTLELSDKANNKLSIDISAQQITKINTTNINDASKGIVDLMVSFDDNNPNELTGNDRKKWYESHFKLQEYLDKTITATRYVKADSDGKYRLYLWGPAGTKIVSSIGTKENELAVIDKHGKATLVFNSINELKNSSNNYVIKHENKTFSGLGYNNTFLKDKTTRAFDDTLPTVTTNFNIAGSNTYVSDLNTYEAVGTTRPIVTGKSTPFTFVHVKITDSNDPTKVFETNAKVNGDGTFRADFNGINNGTYDVETTPYLTDPKTAIGSATTGKLLVNTNAAVIEAVFQDGSTDLIKYVDTFNMSDKSEVNIKLSLQNAIDATLTVIKTNDPSFTTINKVLTTSGDSITESLIGLENGEYVITISASNTSGNKTTETKYLIVNKDPIENRVEGLVESYLEREGNSIAAAKESQTTAYKEVAITGNINKPFSTIALTVGTNLSPLKTVADNEGNWTVVIPAVYVKTGVNSYKVNASDLNGNKAAEITKTFTSNSVTPTANVYAGKSATDSAYDNNPNKVNTTLHDQTGKTGADARVYVTKKDIDYTSADALIAPSGPSADATSTSSPLLPNFRLNGSRIVLGGTVTDEVADSAGVRKPLLNAKVTITIQGGGTIATDVVYTDSKGNWNYSDTSDRPDGVYNYTINYETTYGIPGAAPIKGSVQLKNNVAIVNEGLTPKSDSTPFDNDHTRTEKRNPTIHGKVDSDAILQISFDSGLTWEDITIDKGSSTWEYNFSSSKTLESLGRSSSGEVSVGNIQYFLRAVDKLSNVSLIRGEITVTDNGLLEAHIVPVNTRELTQAGYPVIKTTTDITNAFKVSYKANIQLVLEVSDANGVLIKTLEFVTNNNGYYQQTINQTNFGTDGKYGIISYKVSEKSNPKVFTEGKYYYSSPTSSVIVNSKLLDSTNTGSTTDKITANDSPSLTGTSNPGALVEIYIDEKDGAKTLLTTIASAIDGGWTVQVPARNVPLGSTEVINYSVKVTLPDGISTGSEKNSFTINKEIQTFDVSSGLNTQTTITYPITLTDSKSSVLTAKIYEFNLETGLYDKFIRTITQHNRGNTGINLQINKAKYGLLNSSFKVKFSAEDSVGNPMKITSAKSDVYTTEHVVSALSLGVKVPSGKGEFIDNVWYTQGEQDIIGTVSKSNVAQTISMVVTSTSGKSFLLTKSVAPNTTDFSFTNDEILKGASASSLNPGTYRFRVYVGTVNSASLKPDDINSATIERKVEIVIAPAELYDYNFVIDKTTVQSDGETNPLNVATGGKTHLIGRVSQGNAKVYVFYTEEANKDELDKITADNLDTPPADVISKVVYSYDGRGNFTTKFDFPKGTYAMKIIPVSFSGMVGKATDIGVIDVAAENPTLSIFAGETEISPSKNLDGADNTASIYLKLNTSTTLVTKVYGIDAKGVKTLIYTSDKQIITSDELAKANKVSSDFNTKVDIQRAVLDTKYTSFEYEVTATNAFGKSAKVSDTFKIDAASFNVSGSLVPDTSTSGAGSTGDIIGFSKLSSVTINATPQLSGIAAPGAKVTVKVYAGVDTKAEPVQTLTATSDATTSVWTADIPSTNPLISGRYTMVATQTGSGATLGQQAQFVIDVSTGDADRIPEESVIVSSDVDNTKINPIAVAAGTANNTFADAALVGYTNNTNNLWISGKLDPSTNSNAVVTLVDSEGNDIVGKKYLVTKDDIGRWMFELPPGTVKDGENFYKVQTITTGGKESPDARYFKFEVDQVAPTLTSNALKAEKSIRGHSNYDKAVDDVKDIKFSTKLGTDVVKLKVVVNDGVKDLIHKEFDITSTTSRDFSTTFDKTLLPHTDAQANKPLNFKVTAFDKAGNETTYQSTFRLTDVHIDQVKSDGFTNSTIDAASVYDDLDVISKLNKI